MSTPSYALDTNFMKMSTMNFNMSMPNFNMPAANFNMGIGAQSFNFNPSIMGIGSGSSGSSSSSSSPGIRIGESYDQFIERTNKNREKNYSKYKQLLDEIAQYNASVKDVQEIVDDAKTAKVDKETGVLMKEETMADYKKQPWWKKALRAGGNMVQGAWSLATELVGYEQNPETGERKWNWKKLAKNAAIAAGCIALTCIPVVGPIISTTLLASGVVAGAIGLGKGISMVCKAEKPEDIDKGFQEIGKGIVVGGTSAMGLRGLGKGFRMAEGLSGKGGFFRDMTVNAFKATKSAAASQKAAVAQNGWWSTFGSNLKNAFIPKLGRKKMEKAIQDTNTSIDNRVAEIDKRLNFLEQQTGHSYKVEEAVLRQEKAALAGQKTQISKLKTKEEWADFLGKDKTGKLKTKFEDYDIGTKVFTKDAQGNKVEHILQKEDLTIVERAASRMGEYSNQAAELVKTRESSMHWMSLGRRNKAAVKQYNGRTLKSNFFGRLWDFIRPEPKTTFFGKAWNCIKFPFKIILDIFMGGFLFKGWNLMKDSPTASVFKFEATVVNPIYEESMFNSLLGMGKQAQTSAKRDGKVLTLIKDGKSVALAGEDGQAIALKQTDIDELKKYIETTNQKLEELRQNSKDLYNCVA